jgi:pimeloyl-ACP methyl ester carboxylesterase
MALPPPARWPGGRVLSTAVAGGEIIVETLGAGPPLLMLHGWTLDRRMWGPQLPLAGDFTLIGIDRRGFGQSTAPADLAAEPADVLRVAEALSLRQFHLLGMSQGGRVALAVAAVAPERLRSLTLQGTALDGVMAADEAVPLAAMQDAARQGRPAEMRRLLAGHPLMRVAHPAGVALVATMVDDYGGRDLLAPARGLAASADIIQGAGFPVTAIVGAEDTAQRRANARALAAAGAAMIELPGAGHLCNIDRPDAFNALIGETAR